MDARRAAFAQDLDLQRQPVLHPVGRDEALATDLPVQWLYPPLVHQPTTLPSSQIGSQATTSASPASTTIGTSFRVGPSAFSFSAAALPIQSAGLFQAMKRSRPVSPGCSRG
jgi:hypothetical protein